ncbi:MAG: amidohydrolase [Bacteroidales bacterium]|nr:amidohydrolase [Bacteroidales bacterium]
MQNLSLTLLQADLIWENTEKNLAAFDDRISMIDQVTDLIVLPEMFNTGFSIHPENIAEPPFGKTFIWMQQKAAQKNAAISGSVLTQENDKYYNRLYFVFPDGSHRQYNKKHLFRLGKEWQVFSAGSQKLILEYKGWKICPLICYDLRFPVWSKNRLIKENYEYDLLIYVANWPEVRNHAWKHLLIARAIENQAYVVGVNRVGTDGNGVDHSGDSIVLNGQGQKIAQAQPFQDEMITADLSKTELEDFRSLFPFSLDWDVFKIHQEE